MENKSDYQLIVEEYRQVCDEYEAATARMVALAAKPECDVVDFQQLSQRVAQLSERLSRLRVAMKITYGRGPASPEPPLAC